MEEYIEELLDNYRPISLLGKGGFGRVYLAEHIYHKTRVALKVLPPLDQDDLPNFLNEARTFRLNHRHIVRMLDFGVAHGVPFLVMEYAPNGSLRLRHPKGTRLALPAIMSYVKQIAEALQYAHNERLIHRDVKPENMLIGAQNELLLSDFGAALIAHSSFFKVTQSVVGTATYMAPEQLEGKPCFASDQYALGIVVYEWLCGTPPFQGNLVQLDHCHHYIPPPSLRARVPALSPYVERVMMRALAKEANQRFSSVREFADALEQAGQETAQRLFLPPIPALQPSIYAQTEQISVPQAFPPTVVMPPFELPPARRSVSRRKFMGGAIVIGAGIVAGASLLIALEMAKGSQGSSGPPAPHLGQTLITYYHQNEVFTCAWSQADTLIASAGGDQNSREGDTAVHVWDSRTGQDVIVLNRQGHTKVVRSVNWSPLANDHRLVSGGEDGQVIVWDTETGNGNPLYTNAQNPIMSVAWSPDAKHIVFGGSDGFVRVLDVSSGTILPLYQHGDLVDSVSWSRDGKRIVSGSVDKTVKIWNASSGTITEQTHAIVGAVAWSPGGAYIASGEYDDKTGTVHSDSDAIQLWDAQGRHILTYPGSADGHQIYSVAWSPDSKFVVSGGQDTQVNIWEALTGKRISSYQGHSSYRGPDGEHGYVMAARWSHSGFYIASCGFDKTVQVWAASQWVLH